MLNIQGCLSIEVNGRTVGTSELSVILWVSTVEECCRVPLYNQVS